MDIVLSVSEKTANEILEYNLLDKFIQKNDLSSYGSLDTIF